MTKPLMMKFRYFYTCLFLALITVACLLDFSDAAQKIHTFNGFDKLVHAGMYFVLSYIFIWEYRCRKHLLPGLRENMYEATDHLYRLFWYVMLLCVLFGGIIEYVQGLTAYRSMEKADLTADFMGGLFAYLVYYLLVIIKRNH